MSCTRAETKSGTCVFENRYYSEREIIRKGYLIFHSISKENEERKLAPMSKSGVKMITRLASFLHFFEKPSREQSENTETEVVKEPEPVLPAQERLALTLYPNRRIATMRATLAIA